MKGTEKTIRKLIMVAMAIMLVFGAIGCKNSNPLTDPMNPMNPNSPLNPNNQNRFTASKATSAIVNIINGLDKKIISEDLEKLRANMIPDSADASLMAVEEASETEVSGMSIVMSVVYDGTIYSSKPTGGECNLSDIFKILSPDAPDPDTGLMDILSSVAEEITTTVEFSGYTHGVKEQLKSIDSGTITMTINPGDMGGANGIIPMEMNSIKVSMSDGKTYTIDTTELYLAFIDGDPRLPIKDDTSSITIADAKGNLQSVTWKAVATSTGNKTDENMYASETKENIISMSFYSHFGSHHFLNALYNEIKNPDSFSELSFSNYPFKITKGEYEDDDQFLVNITFNKYHYYKNDTPQSVSGNVYFLFYGSIEENDNTFNATGFKIYSDKLTLSDDNGNHNTAYITFGTKKERLDGKFGSDLDGNIVFMVNDNNGEKAITGITKYVTKDTTEEGEIKYDATSHAFVLNEEDYPTIEF